MSDVNTFPLISIAIRDGNGETDARSPVQLIGPTVGRCSVRTRPGLDFDHFQNGDLPIYIDVANFPAGALLGIVGELGVEFQDANIPSVLHGDSTVIIMHDGRGQCLGSSPVNSQSGSSISVVGHE